MLKRTTAFLGATGLLLALTASPMMATEKPAKKPAEKQTIGSKLESRKKKKDEEKNKASTDSTSTTGAASGQGE